MGSSLLTLNKWCKNGPLLPLREFSNLLPGFFDIMPLSRSRTDTIFPCMQKYRLASTEHCLNPFFNRRLKASRPRLFLNLILSIFNLTTDICKFEHTGKVMRGYTGKVMRGYTLLYWTRVLKNLNLLISIYFYANNLQYLHFLPLIPA